MFGFLEAEYKDIKQRVETMLADGKITYDFLWYTFYKGVDIMGHDLNEEPIGGTISNVIYVTGFFSRFIVSSHVVKSNGKKFFAGNHTAIINEFKGVRSIQSLPIRLLDDAIGAKLKERGKIFARVGVGAHYMTYTGHIVWRERFSTNMYKADGRVMVDGKSFYRINGDYSGGGCADLQ